MIANKIKELKDENKRLKFRIEELINQCDEIYELLKQYKSGYWWCETCLSHKLPSQVTADDFCTNCGNDVQWVEDIEGLPIIKKEEK